MQDRKSPLVVVLSLLSVVLLVALFIVSGQQDPNDALMVEVDGEKRLVTAEEFLALQLASQQHPTALRAEKTRFIHGAGAAAPGALQPLQRRSDCRGLVHSGYSAQRR